MTVTWSRELERRRTARQAEPGGLEGLWGEGFVFINIKIVFKGISSFSGRKGRLARSFGLYGYSWEDLTRICDFDNQFGFLTFTFCSFSFLFVLSSVLDKDPSGLKVLALNKIKVKRSLCFAVENNKNHHHSLFSLSPKYFLV